MVSLHKSYADTLMSNVNIIAPISTGTDIHRYTTNMAKKIELAKQSVPIKKVPKGYVDSVMRVLVIRRGSIIPYKNSRHQNWQFHIPYFTMVHIFVLIPPLHRQLIGDKDKETPIKKHIETCKDSLKLNMTYYIGKGCLYLVNPNYSSVHKEHELTFTDNINHKRDWELGSNRQIL